MKVSLKFAVSILNLVLSTRIELVMAGYQPTVIPFNYKRKYGAPSRIRTYGFADLQSTALGLSAIGAYLVEPEGIEPNCQPPYILRQRIYSPP